MSTLSAVDTGTVEADLSFLMNFADKNRERYSTARPFPHISLDSFLRPEVLDAVVRDFPARDSEPWQAMADKDQKKFAANEVSKMAPTSSSTVFSE